MTDVGSRKRHPDPLYAEQVRLLYANAPLAYIITLINGTLLAYIQSERVPLSVVFSWYACLLIATAARVYMIWRYRRARPGAYQARFWNIAYLIGAAVAGSVWGGAAVMLFTPDSIAHQVFIAFVLAGMAAGGVSVLAPRMEVCLAFLVPALLPLAVRFLTLDMPIQTTMGVMTLIFLAALSFSAWNFHRVIRTSLHLRFDKQQLEAEVVQRQRTEERLFQEKDRLQTTVSSIGEGVALIDAEGRIEYVNPAAEQLFGQPVHHLLHHRPNQVFECFDEQGSRISTALEDCLRSSTPQRKQCVLYGKHRVRYVVEEMATPLLDRLGKLVGAVSVFRDVTESKRLIEQLVHAADHDVLTGLPNRNLLRVRTSQAIARARRKHGSFALLYVDLDHFKEVNDTLGHACGDALLVDVAKRIADCVRQEDTVARIGGDEFVVLLDSLTQQSQVDAVGDKILRTLREPFQFSALCATVTASIGASLYPRDGVDVESLLGHADAAMYRAKHSGRDQLA